MLFQDRQDAAKQLLWLLEEFRNKEVVVLAIPRGGVPIGCILAKELNASLDLLLSKKIGAPGNPEFAIGAVGPDFIWVESQLDIDPSYIEKETNRIRAELTRRQTIFNKYKTPTPLKDKIVIITDDGIATGRTILAALPTIRKQQPDSIIVATPVCSPQARTLLEPQVEQLISCADPDPFIGVGRFYQNFEEVTDQQVLLLLDSFYQTHTHVAKN